ncbi:MAG: autotransporter outer membrane beta-barrel domain-containing protein [Deltaproteobacteria bacterium]|jgi:hypothetical protein|nr:autotransporter outer membrane beta-barrel domain-containing protein [Deltaproteobacteria bacterium]
MKKLMTLALCIGLLGWALPSLAFQSREARDRAFQDLSYKAIEQKAQSLNNNQAPPAGEGSPMVVALVPEFSYSHHKAFQDVVGGVQQFIGDGNSKLGSMALVLTKPINDLWSVYFLYQYSYSDYEGSSFTPINTAIARVDRSANAYSNFIGIGTKLAHPLAGNFDFNIVEAWNTYRSSSTEFDATGAITSGPTESVSYDDRLTSMILYWDKDLAIDDTWTINPYLGWRSVWAVVHPAVGEDAHLWLHLATGGVKVKYKSGNLGLYFRGGYNYRVSDDNIQDLATRAIAPGVLQHGWFASYDRDVATWGLGFNYNFKNGWFIDVSYNGMAGKINYVHSGTAVVVLPF